MAELLFAPDVRIVGHTVMDEAVLGDWADYHGFGAEFADPNTPLGDIANAAFDDLQAGVDRMGEFGGRFCYRSFAKGRPADEYIRNIVEMEHGSVLEHGVVNFAISGVSRALTHELIRHRAGASPSQESQRYVDASEIRFVVPPLLIAMCKTDIDAGVLAEGIQAFGEDCDAALQSYKSWQATFNQWIAERGQNADDAAGVKLATMRKKRANEAARALLPNATETRLLWTMNLRAARHVCALRGSEHADLEIRRLAVEITRQLKKLAPMTFWDFEIYMADDGFEAVSARHPKV